MVMVKGTVATGGISTATVVRDGRVATGRMSWNYKRKTIPKGGKEYIKGWKRIYQRVEENIPSGSFIASKAGQTADGILRTAGIRGA